MKALFLAAGAAMFAAATPAPASIVVIGSTLAEGCFQAAKTKDTTYHALQTCDRALSEEPLTIEDEFATYVNRGIVRMLRHDFVSAKSDFDRAIAMNPNRGEPYVNMGIMRLNQGDPAGAITLLSRSIELGTERPEIAYYGRAMAHEDIGNVKAAYADLKRAVSLKPEWQEPAQQLARYQVVRR